MGRGAWRLRCWDVGACFRWEGVHGVEMLGCGGLFSMGRGEWGLGCGPLPCVALGPVCAFGHLPEVFQRSARRDPVHLHTAHASNITPMLYKAQPAYENK
eukprot:609249-Prorocentrum_minimum.AAC.2